MAQLTWREVSNPNFGVALGGLSDASQAIGGSFNNLAQNLSQIGQRQRTQDTGAAQLALSQYGSNQDLQAAIAAGLTGDLQNQFGNLDQGALAQYLNTYAGDLQKREATQQGIDTTNNLNQFGGDISQILIDARNGVPGASQRLAQLTQQGLSGGVASQFAPQIADASGRAGQDAETSRNNLAQNAIGRTNAGANVMNAQTSRMGTQAEIEQRNRQWAAGGLQRQVSDAVNTDTLATRENIDKGAQKFDPNSGDSPDVQRGKIVRSMANASPKERDALLSGFDSSVQSFLNPNNPQVQQAAAATAPVSNQVSAIATGAKGIIANAAQQANPWVNAWSAAEGNGAVTIPDAITKLKDFGLDTTDRKVNSLVQQAVDMGATPAEAVAIASGAGRGSYTSLVDGKITLDSSAFIDGVKDYLKYKTSTDGIKQRQSITEQNNKVDSLTAPVQKLIKDQQWALAQGRTDRAAALQPRIDAANRELQRYVGLVQETNKPPAPVAPQYTQGWQPSWAPTR